MDLISLPEFRVTELYPSTSRISRKIGRFNESLHYCKDSDFYLKAIAKNLKLGAVPKEFFIHIQHEAPK
jgi:hypothetical protein